MGGGGTVSIEALAICRKGVRNVRAHLGVTPEIAAPLNRPGRVLQLKGPSAYVFAGSDGIFEPFHPIGTEVRAGEPAGRIHRTWEPSHQPDTLSYQVDGLLYGRRQPGRVQSGNCCLVVASPYDGPIAA
jgi:predicted deacylase